MEQLRSLGEIALDRARKSMGHLLYGLDPKLSLDDLQDKMSSHRQGYYFVKESANGLEGAYLELLSKACLHPGDGLMSAEVWKLDAVRRFLKEESSLLTHIMLMMYLRGGQAPRTTEFLSIECWNGPSTSRGIYIHHGSLIYVTRHSKARRMTNHEFHIARYLPQEDLRLVATYLAVVRPFAEMLSRVCLGRERERRLMFSHADTADKHWTSDMLTAALKTLTQDVSKQAFGVQIYRQLSIAVTERHVKQINRPFSLNDDKSIAADIEVVFAWQSGHRPVQRGSSYDIDAAYPDSLQPALLRVYEWASKEWHQFLRVNRRCSEPMGNLAPMDREQMNPSHKRAAADVDESQSSKRARVHEDNDDPVTMVAMDSPVALSDSSQNLESVFCDSSLRLSKTADKTPASSGRQKDRPVVSPPPVRRQLASGNVMLPSPIQHYVPHEQSTARSRSDAGSLDSDYETVPESPFENRTHNPVLPVSAFEKPGKDLLKDVGECVAWWLGRCPFCVGKGFREREVMHHMQDCSRGGQEQHDRGLGEHFFLSEFRVKRGCRSCGLPFSVCGAWKHLKHKKSNRKLWRRLDSAHCVSEWIAYEVTVGLYQCGVEYYWMDLSTVAEEAGVDLDDLEELAVWLCKPLWYNKSRATNLLDFFIRWSKKVHREK